MRLLTGRGRFSDDFALPGQAHAAMLRSPHPHARILSVDKTAALALPGILAVFTGADCAADGLRPLDHSPLPKTRFDLKLHGPGGGEGGTTPALAVIVNAILDALKPLGVADLTMPATPFRVWSAIRAARRG